MTSREEDSSPESRPYTDHPALTKRGAFGGAKFCRTQPAEHDTKYAKQPSELAEQTGLANMGRLNTATSDATATDPEVSRNTPDQ